MSALAFVEPIDIFQKDSDLEFEGFFAEEEVILSP
jgi:hypothetical protein